MTKKRKANNYHFRFSMLKNGPEYILVHHDVFVQSLFELVEVILLDILNVESWHYDEFTCRFDDDIFFDDVDNISGDEYYFGALVDYISGREGISEHSLEPKPLTLIGPCYPLVAPLSGRTITTISPDWKKVYLDMGWDFVVDVDMNDPVIVSKETVRLSAYAIKKLQEQEEYKLGDFAAALVELESVVGDGRNGNRT